MPKCISDSIKRFSAFLFEKQWGRGLWPLPSDVISYLYSVMSHSSHTLLRWRSASARSCLHGPYPRNIAIFSKVGLCLYRQIRCLRGQLAKVCGSRNISRNSGQRMRRSYHATVPLSCLTFMSPDLYDTHEKKDGLHVWYRQEPIWSPHAGLSLVGHHNAIAVAEFAPAFVASALELEVRWTKRFFA